MADGAVFCSQCGTRTDASPVSSPESYGKDANYAAYQIPEDRGFAYGQGYNEQPVYGGGYYDAGDAAAVQVKTQKKNKLIGIIAVAAVVVIAAIVVLLIVFGGGKRGAKTPEEVFDLYMEAFDEGDGKKLLNLVPEVMIDSVLDRGLYKDLGEIESYFQEIVFNTKRDLTEQYGAGFSMRYTILDTYTYDSEDLAAYNEDFEPYGIRFEGAKDLNVEVVFQFDGGEETMQSTLTVVLLDGRWYMPEPG